ncbi:XRE family transcriptional regulator [Paracoccus alkanivorans]|uniref:XRE family transcriptional regulator n=1 Tax=Paracoccus alkanivorans TaxID=2116655 RepID=A0A3M0MDJ7_9RHOB|nr:XRE family transcriptional regulator [Paracoccus alkanivorans]RMC34394.1 XRE family transcriptional regulator [Paracoccus alkanivorans]
MSKPYAGTSAAKLIADHVRDLKHCKTQDEIAAEAGFRNANLLTMLKSGKNEVPLDRVPDLARALEVDPAHLMRSSLEQWIGSAAAAAVVSVFGTPITKNELQWINEIRDASDHKDPHITGKGRAAIRGHFGK